MTSALDVMISFVLLATASTLPSSLVLVEARKGRFQAWLLIAAFGGVCFALGGPDFSAWMLAWFVAPAVAVGACMRFTPRLNWVFIAGIVTAVCCLLGFYAIAAAGADFSLADLEAFYRSAISDLKEAAADYGLPQESLNQFPGGSDRLFSYMILLSPSLGFSAASILIWLNLLLVIKFSAGGKPFRGKTDLSEWSAPEPLVFGVLLPAVAMTLLRHRLNYAISGNLLVAFMIPFFFQGMAITSHTLRRLRLSPGLRFLAYALLFGVFGAMVVPAQAAMGILDIWLDFRRLRKPAKPETKEPDDQEGDQE